jgi:hypothetical protein
LEVAGVPQFRVQTDDRTADPRRAANLQPPVVARSPDRLIAGRWAHLAGVYDGRAIALFVNGRKVASTNAANARLSSDKSLYIGARPNGAWNTHNFSSPLIYWRGAVDDVRISRVARYNGNFSPETHLPRDPHTLLAFSHDQHFGPFVPAFSERPVHAWFRGDVRMVPEYR